ncbi:MULTISPECIES: hypothetical protein [Rhizobium]|uniref:hypothetical protein n=1 Tax=Rhizobium TaxID=379 RepID=UPI001030C5A7|nr:MULTISPECIES: hypothetical protein [Rhizobium]TAX30747.1 hypothetical protein ELI04_13675 [Rhizobium leguminosarum]TBD43291.1 hypothetical protein ELH19_14215 [Rhizobium ruizarguesonis]
MHNASGKELKRDRALQWHMHADYERMVEAGIPLPAGRTKRDRQAIASICSGIISSARAAPGQWMSYSRSESWYPGQEMYYGDAFGYSTVVGAMEKLADGPLIEAHIKARPGDHLKKARNGLTLQSRVLPAVASSKIILPKMDNELAQSIRLRRRDDKRLVAYKDTESILRMRNMLTKLNAHYAEADIEFHGGRREGDVVFHVSKRGHEYGVDLTNRACHRVFSDVFTLGGRYYGAAWQALGKDARAQIVINGEEVFEADFATLHPGMLYHAAGLRLEGDAYDIPGYRDQRDACKRGVNILINADSYSEAVYALTEHVSGGYHEAAEMIECIMEKHAPIAHYFHSDAGIRLQRIDSQICTDILNDFTIKKGITVLSVHDSFIVPSSHKETIVEAMERHYKNRVDGVARILNSCLKTKDFRLNPLHKGYFSLRLTPPAAFLSADPVSESNRNRMKIQNRNRKNAHATKETGPKTNTEGSKTVRSNSRWDKLKRKPQTTPTAQTEDLETVPLMAANGNLQEKAVAGIGASTTSVDTVVTAGRIVCPVSDDSVRNGAPFADLPVEMVIDEAGETNRRMTRWQPRKTSVLEIVREEEARRDALQHRRRERSH